MYINHYCIYILFILFLTQSCSPLKKDKNEYRIKQIHPLCDYTVQIK